MRALIAAQPLTVSQIAKAAAITQPAATQTVNLMIAEGLASSTPDAQDARRRSVQLTRAGPKLLPTLQRCWRASLIPGIQSQISALGSLESVTFVKVGTNGETIFAVLFANAEWRWGLELDEDGRIAMAYFHPRQEGQ